MRQRGMDSVPAQLKYHRPEREGEREEKEREKEREVRVRQVWTVYLHS